MSKALKWIDNFWYHYKWTFIVVTFFLVIGIVLTFQLITKEEYDAYVMYVGDTAIPDTMYQDILDSLETVVKDYDENGEINVNFQRLGFITDETGERLASVKQAPIGSTICVQVADGKLKACVEESEEAEGWKK